MFIRKPDDLRNLLAGSRQNNDIRFVPKQRQRVALIDE